MGISFGKINGVPEVDSLKKSVLEDFELMAEGMDKYLQNMRESPIEFSNLESCQIAITSMREVIQKLLRENLEERFEYGTVMAHLDVDSDWWGQVQSEISNEDIYTKVGDRSYGRQTNKTAHVTILYGLHGDVSVEDVDAILSNAKLPSEVKLKRLDCFENDNGFDVVKFDLDGEGLVEINSALAKLPHTTDFPKYHPHLTLAYVKEGTGRKYIRNLKNDEPANVRITKVVYNKTDGTVKEYKL